MEDKISFNKKQKNIDIEFLRFIMIALVALLHFSEDYFGNHGIMPGGYLGVDFFFIISGFFLIKHFEKDYNKEKSLGKKARVYIWYRIKQLYIPYIISILFYVVTLWWMNEFNIKWLLNHLWENKWQFLLLHYLGAAVPFEFRSIWFMSSLVVLSYLIYFLLEYNKQFFIGIIPVIIIGIYVWIYVTYGTLSMQGNYMGFLHGSVVRGFAGMSLGVLAYDITGEKELKRNIQVNIIKIILFIFILYIMYRYGFDINDFTVIPAMFLLVILSYIQPFVLPMFLRKIILYLGKISYWIYLLHLLVSLWLVNFIPNKGKYMIIVFFIITIIFSVIMQEIVTRIQRKYGK